jgi:hypothetical protein
MKIYENFALKIIDLSSVLLYKDQCKEFCLNKYPSVYTRTFLDMNI